MRYEIYHQTLFHYPSVVTFSHNIMRLTPQQTPFQEVKDWSIVLEPQEDEQSHFLDMFGNLNHHLLIRTPHQELSLTARMSIELNTEAIHTHALHVKQSSLSYEKALERLSSYENQEVLLFRFPSLYVPYASDAIKAYALVSFHPKRDLYEALEEFMGRMYQDFSFVQGFSTVSTPIETIFEAKKGVCQDFSHFAIGALRSIGLPVRYVSGYIETLPKEGEEKLFGVDASHAWCSLYLPRAGWIDFDPTNNQFPKEHHCVLGYGRDYDDIAPLKGVVMSNGESELSIRVDMRRSIT